MSSIENRTTHIYLHADVHKSHPSQYFPLMWKIGTYIIHSVSILYSFHHLLLQLAGLWPAANEWLLRFTQVQPSHVFYSSVWQRRYLIKWTEQIFLLSFNNYSDLYLCSCSSAPGHTWLLSWTRDIHDTGVVLLRHTISITIDHTAVAFYSNGDKNMQS